jgi:hypothetical protein
MRGPGFNRNRSFLGAAIFIGLAACATTALAQDTGACISATVPEAFTLPDGSVHAAGRITLCTHQVLNPSAGLHTVSVDGDGASLVMSKRSRPNEFDGDHAAVLFRRVPGEPLELVGYVVPFGRKAWSYTLRHTNGNGFAEAAPLAKATATGEMVTLLASNTN